MKIDFITIYTDKRAESITFYTDVLGFILDKQMDVGGGVALVFLSDGEGGYIELVDRGTPVPKSENCPVAITIKVDDIHKTDRMVEEQGCTKTFGPITLPNGISLLHILDPNGVTINFVEMGEEH